MIQEEEDWKVIDKEGDSHYYGYTIKYMTRNPSDSGNIYETIYIDELSDGTIIWDGLLKPTDIRKVFTVPDLRVDAVSKISELTDAEKTYLLLHGIKF